MTTFVACALHLFNYFFSKVYMLNSKEKLILNGQKVKKNKIAKARHKQPIPYTQEMRNIFKYLIIC